MILISGNGIMDVITISLIMHQTFFLSYFVDFFRYIAVINEKKNLLRAIIFFTINLFLDGLKMPEFQADK
jgi:hypothetical protein